MKLWTSVAWSVVYLLLLLSLATPLTVITAFFLIVPGVLLYTTLSTRSFLLHIAIVWLIASVMVGPIILLQAVYFILPSIAMGFVYKRKGPALRAMMAGAGMIVLDFLLILLISTVFFDFNLTRAIEDMVNELTPLLQEMFNILLAGKVAWSPELSEQFSSLTVRMIPSTMVVCALIMAAIAHAISRPTLSSLGHALPKLAPLRDWRLPRSLIWYFLLATLLQSFGGTAINEGFVGTILLNLIPLLQFLFMVQAASFFFFVAYHRKWNPVFPVLSVMVLLLIPPLWIIGMLDIAFPLRDAMTRTRR